MTQNLTKKMNASIIIYKILNHLTSLLFEHTFMIKVRHLI